MTISPRIWNQIVQSASRGIGSVDLISPFGFELLEGESHRVRNVSRFYVYYRSETVGEGQLLQALLGHLNDFWPGLHARVSVIGTRSEGTRALKPGFGPQDCFLHVERVETRQPIVRSYARYMAGMIDAMALGDLPELAKIGHSGTARLRIRQLFRIAVDLYPDLRRHCIEAPEKLSQSPVGIDPSRKQKITPEEREQITNIVLSCRDFVETGIFRRSAARREIDMFGTSRKRLIRVDPGLFDEVARRVEHNHCSYYTEAAVPEPALRSP